MASPAAAHELWIEPESFQLQASSNIVGNLINGQNFEGTQLTFLPRNFEQFAIINVTQVVDVDSRLGDRPAINQEAPGPGLNIIVYEARHRTLTYDTFDEFDVFAMFHGVSDMSGRHLELGLPLADFKEVYTRHSKALVTVGAADGEDRRLGLEAELVALANPYLLEPADELPVQLFFGNGPLANTQIELYARSPFGDVTMTTHRTDANGVAMLPTMPGYDYMANAVIFRQPHERYSELDPVWETLWANLTFAVPD